MRTFVRVCVHASACECLHPCAGWLARAGGRELGLFWGTGRGAVDAGGLAQAPARVIEKHIPGRRQPAPPSSTRPLPAACGWPRPRSRPEAGWPPPRPAPTQSSAARPAWREGECAASGGQCRASIVACGLRPRTPCWVKQRAQAAPKNGCSSAAQKPTALARPLVAWRGPSCLHRDERVRDRHLARRARCGSGCKHGWGCARLRERRRSQVPELMPMGDTTAPFPPRSSAPVSCVPHRRAC